LLPAALLLLTIASAVTAFSVFSRWRTTAFLPLSVSAFHSLPIKAFLPRTVTAVQPQQQLMFFKLWQIAAMLLSDFLSIKSLRAELGGGRLTA
jgi:hypothetical protein